MKKIIYILGLFISVFCVSCEYDNYDPPQIEFTGKLTYGNKTLQFDGADGSLSKIIELYQTGFGKTGASIPAAVSANGTFRQLIFPGDYQIVMKNTPYPFTFDNWNTRPTGGYDSLKVKISGSYNLDIPVTPYFDISDVTWETVGTNVNVTFRINRIQAGANITKARVYVNTANIVNSSARASAETTVTDISKPVTVQLSIPDYRTKYANNFRDYAFIRVALETDKSPTYFLWSEIYKVEGLPIEFNDVTADYLTNYKQEFEHTPLVDGRRATVIGWSFDPSMERTMYDGWGDRRFMGAENWGGANLLTGSVWQSPTLPAGKYVFAARRGWNSGDLGGRTDRAYLVVSKGETLQRDGANLIGKADCGLPGNSQSMSINFELTEETKVSMGYSINFLGRETNAVSFTSFTILKVD